MGASMSRMEGPGHPVGGSMLFLIREARGTPQEKKKKSCGLQFSTELWRESLKSGTH